MDGFEFNKIIGWCLAAVLVLVGGRTYMEIANEGHGNEHASKPAYVIEIEEDEVAGKAETKTTTAAFDIKTLLATADVDSGIKFAKKKCAGCHSFEKGGKSGAGPNLYGIVNRKKASLAGFAYSDAMKAKGGNWDFDSLASFIRKPSKFVSGTRMSFGGLKKDERLASVIAYLRSLSDQPAPLK